MLVSVIIPCRDRQADLSGLRKDLEIQDKNFDLEIIEVLAVRPVGKARNQGAATSRGEILVFLDADVRLPQRELLRNLIGPLGKDKDVGATCASVRIPPDAGEFEKRYAGEVPHAESPIVETLTEVQVATSACFAIPRELFNRIGGFHEVMVRGEDSVISEQVRQAGSRVVLVPGSWCYHHQPQNLRGLIRNNFRDGKGSCFVDVFYPELNLDIHPSGVTYFSDKKTLPQRAVRFLSSSLRAVAGWKMLLVLSKVFYATGYMYGCFKYRLLRMAPD